MLHVIAAILVVLVLFFVAMYNNLVHICYRCDEALSNVETELKRRYVLIPNLVSIVKGYASHEKYLLEQLVKLREKASYNPNSILSPADEAKFSQKLNSLMVKLEAYPNLKANQNFRELQIELANTEDRIQAALRFYNCNVRIVNSTIRQFPSNIVANAFDFEIRQFFVLEDATAQTAPTIQF